MARTAHRSLQISALVLAGHPEAALRQNAARELAAGTVTPGVRAALEMLRRDVDPEVRLAATPFDPPANFLGIRLGAYDRVVYHLSREDNAWARQLAASRTRLAHVRLATDVEPTVRRVVAAHAFEPDTLKLLATDPVKDVRLAVASNYNTPDEVLVALHSDSDGQVRVASAKTLAGQSENARISEDGRLSIEVHELLSARPGGEVAATQLVRSLPLTLRESLAAYLWPERYKATTLLFRVLGEDAEPAVRAAVAGNPGVPERLLSALADDPDPWVRRWVALRSSTIPVVERLAHDSSEQVLEALLCNQLAPSWALARSAAKASRSYRELAALHPGADASLLAELAADGEAAVRRAVAANVRTPPEALSSLAADRVTEVRECVAANRSCPEATLMRLARSAAPSVRLLVALNRRTPAETLVALATDADVEVRQATATNGRTPAEAWESLTRDDDPGVQRLLAENPSAPVWARRQLAQRADANKDALAVLSMDEDWRVRVAAARNRSTPTDALLTLANDSKWRVRKAVASRR